MWNAWDFAAEAALAQLEKYVADPDNVTFQVSGEVQIEVRGSHCSLA